jgi:hypothetical protein
MNLLYEELATLLRGPSRTRNHPVWKSNRKQAVFLLLLWTGFRCHRQERHTSYLLPGYSEISMYAWKSYKILTYMIIISYPGTTLSNAHELTLSSLLQINVWRASVDGAPILKLGDSSVYLASLFFLYKDNQIIYIYLCVYI